MTDMTLVDNDVVLKLCCYGCHEVLAAHVGRQPAAMLAIGRFTLRDRVKRSRRFDRPDELAVALENAMASLRLIEPSEEEVFLAAELEERATKLSVELDTGESQLLAVLLRRGCSLLLTGDKRAIIAIHRMSVAEAEGRIACFEQALATAMFVKGLAPLRAAVCSQPGADKAATLIFACGSATISEDDVRLGLASYIAHLRTSSGRMLIGSDDLSGRPTDSYEGTLHMAPADRQPN